MQGRSYVGNFLTTVAFLYSRYYLLYECRHQSSSNSALFPFHIRVEADSMLIRLINKRAFPSFLLVRNSERGAYTLKGKVNYLGRCSILQSAYSGSGRKAPYGSSSSCSTYGSASRLLKDCFRADAYFNVAHL